MDKLYLIDFEKYAITEDGRIFSKHFSRYINGSSNADGYITLTLWCKDNKSRPFYYHRVIWFYFNGDIPQGYEINHIDENKSNNSLSNLELLTRCENVRYGTRTERASKTNSIIQKGRKLSKEHIEKMTIAKSKHVLQYILETGEPIKEWKSTQDVHRTLGYNASFIGRCCRGLCNKAHGYGWKYLQESGNTT